MDAKSPRMMESGTRAPAGLAMPFGRPCVSDRERQAVMDVLAGDILTHGPRVKAFEAAFEQFVDKVPRRSGSDDRQRTSQSAENEIRSLLRPARRAGVPAHAVATSSCTASLHLACMFMDLQPGDEVIVPAMSHVATAHAVELAGGRCVFVDSETATGNIDIEQIEARVTPRTRVIFVVHFLGVPVDMDRVNAVAARHNLFVAEDCALALGATFNGTHAGLLGDCGCFSFYPVKHITTGEGGMTLTRRRDVAEAARLQRAFGIERPARPATPGSYDIIQLGNNYRMQEMSAAMGVVQMERLPGFLEARRANDAALCEALDGMDGVATFAEPDDRFVPSRYCRSVILDDELKRHRARIMRELASRGVGTSVYYPQPIPLMSWYADREGFEREDFPVATWISESTLALPVGPHLSEDDMRFMASALREVTQQVKVIDLAA